jgi:hypothetical protein
MNKARRFKLSKREEWKAGVPLVAAAILIGVSTRPDLAYRKFSQTGNQTDGITLDWPTLYGLKENHAAVEHLRAALPTSKVRVPGYMIAFEQVPDKNSEVTQFLLVPDPGNWLHPPHLDPGDVVFVRLEGGTKARFLDRRPVWAIGKLSLSPVRRGAVEAAYPMWASDVQELVYSK